MKKKLALLLTAAMLLSFGGCGGQNEEVPAEPTTTPVPVQETAPEPITFDVTPAATGKVLFLNPDPDSAADWEALAAAYTEMTGVPVTVSTPEGDYYAALSAALFSGEAPTVYGCDRDMPAALTERSMDLKDTPLYGELTATDCVWLDEGGRVIGVPYALEHYGVIVNTALLEKTGHSLDYLDCFSHFRVAVNDIHARKAELGFDAMASCGLADDSAQRFVNDLPGVFLYMELLECRAQGRPDKATAEYVDDLHNTWDLYRQSSAVSMGALNNVTAEQSLSEFTSQQAVFYVGGSSVYEKLIAAGMTDEQLVMIPLYALIDGNENAALCRRGSFCWALDGSAAKEDINATVDFLSWVITGEEGLTLLHEHYDAVPFRMAPAPEGLFARQDLAMQERGCFPVPMLFNRLPLASEGHSGFLTELRRYTNDPSVYNWYYIAVDALKADWAKYYG